MQGAITKDFIDKEKRKITDRMERCRQGPGMGARGPAAWVPV
jgi:hypothetical protein